MLLHSGCGRHLHTKQSFDSESVCITPNSFSVQSQLWPHSAEPDAALYRVLPQQTANEFALMKSGIARGIHTFYQDLIFARSLPPRVGGEPVILSPPHPTSVASEVSVSQPPESLLHDPDETHDPDHDHDHDPDPDPTAPYPNQRQQHSALPQQSHDTPCQDSAERLSTPASSLQRSLRRIPKFEGAPTPSPDTRQVHIAAASIGFNPSPAATPTPFARTRPDSSISGLSSSLFQDGSRLYSGKGSKNLVEGFEKETSDRGASRHHSTSRSSSLRNRREPHRAVRVSRNTHSAILFALEEALRHPNPFTPDIVEESADMADLMTATSGIPAAANSNSNGPAAPRRPSAGPAPTSSPSGIRGPRMIMQERAAREARQRAEAEQLALERSRAEQEAHLLEEARRRNAERRSAGVAAGQGSGAEPHQQHLQPGPRRHSQVAHESVQPSRNPNFESAVKPSTQQSPPPPPPLPTSPTYVPSAGRPRPQGQQQQQQSAPYPPLETTTQPKEPSKPRSSFPHAFERWETLSAHWEGLTSYWIRKLEQNKDDINRDALSQQLARQVTDLSAAGANLFHAVVELQRLRASSERKFQRWFFETRAELERAQEVNAMLEKALERERRDRADAIREAVDHEKGSSKAQKQIAEMRKELAISKEEARRAWEELGRRAQEERDRTFSLQSGHPTIVGGVQVVPMTHGGVVQQEGTAGDAAACHSDYAQRGYGSDHSQAHAAATPPGAHIIDAAGSFVLDSRGQRIPVVAAPPSGPSVSDLDADDYETPATTNPPSGGHEPTSTTSADDGKWTGAYSEPQNYSGQGYGTPGWETVPRHHHPTRLSDVIEEEDERSRTSATHSRVG